MEERSRVVLINRESVKDVEGDRSPAMHEARLSFKGEQ